MKTDTTVKKDNWKNITSIEAAFKWKGLDPELVPDVSMLPEEYRKYQIAAFRLPIVVEAINEGWELDYTNHDQSKYYFWGEVEANKDNPSGFGFSSALYVSWLTHTHAESRLAFETPEKMRHAYNNFTQLFKDYFLK